jgi:H/ACA ribonucleoprotein complex subunit 3
MTHIRYCPLCQQYTMQNDCQLCDAKTISKHPARFSPQDHYGKYRRALKKLGEQK